MWKEKIDAPDASEVELLEQMAILKSKKRQLDFVGVEVNGQLVYRGGIEFFMTQAGDETSEDTVEEENSGADFMIQGAECSAQVVGDWDDWNPRWLTFNDGVWETKVDLPPGTYRYKVCVLPLIL